jgi:hypothetical protein
MTFLASISLTSSFRLHGFLLALPWLQLAQSQKPASFIGRWYEKALFCHFAIHFKNLDDIRC